MSFHPDRLDPLLLINLGTLHLWIILCTGFSETIDGDKAKALGINAYVTKPIAQKELAMLAIG